MVSAQWQFVELWNLYVSRRHSLFATSDLVTDLLQVVTYLYDFLPESAGTFSLMILLAYWHCINAAVGINCLQQQLSRLSQWSERLRSCEPTFITNNRLFAVTCSYFHHSIIPDVDCICQQTYEYVAAQSVAEAEQLRNELQQFNQVLTYLVCVLWKMLMIVIIVHYTTRLLLIIYLWCKLSAYCLSVAGW